VPVVVPIVLSIVSLLVAIIGLRLSMQNPKAHLDLPDFVRVQQGEQAPGGAGQTNIYVQPSFVSTNSNTRSEVIEDLKLIVKPRQGKPLEFLWLDQGEWLSPDPTQPQSGDSHYAQYYNITSDPTPLVVNPGAAVTPVLHFSAPSADFQFKEGIYDFIVTANRAIVSEPIEDKMTISITEEHVKYFKITAGAQWLFIWNAASQNDQLQSVEEIPVSEPSTNSSEISGIVGQDNQASSSPGAQTIPSVEASSEEASVEAAVRGHYEAIGAGDFEEAYSYFGPTYRKLIDYNKQGWINARKNSQITGSTIKEVNVQRVLENQATATIDVAFQDKGKDSCFFLEWSLVKEGGQWKLDEQLSGEPICG
jgi:hypothetical protein